MPLTPPSTPGLVRIAWTPRSAVGVQASPFTYAQKVYAWSGQQRVFVAELPPMTLAQAKQWHAFVLKLNGVEGTFYFRDTVGATMGGTARGNILVDGGSQTGGSVNLKGLLPNHVKAFAAGDYLSIGDRLYTVLDDAASDATGDCTVNVWPNLVTAPADEAAVSIGPAARGIFRLMSFPEMSTPVSRLMEGFKFSGEEAL